MKNYTPTAYPSSVAIVTEYRVSCHGILCQLSRYTVATVTHQQEAIFGTADIFRGMVSLYVKGEGKWSCPGLRSYRSYGSEVTG